MPINSKKKGAAAERAFAHFLKDHFGLEARRGVQYQGSKDSPDIVCPSLGFCHFEVKAVERLNVYEAMKQAEDDAEDLIPVIAHKRNRSEWLITLKAKDLLGFSSDFIEAYLKDGSSQHKDKYLTVGSLFPPLEKDKDVP